MIRDNRIKVAFLVNSLRFGGAEKHTVGLVNCLDLSRFRVGLVYLKREEHLLSEVNLNRGPVFCPEFGKGWDFAGLHRLSSWLREFSPDLLVCANTYPLFYSFLARSLSVAKWQIIEVFHSTLLSERDALQMRFVYRHFFNRSNRIVYVSHAQRVYWESHNIRPDRAVVVHNGIDVDYFSDGMSEEDRFLRRARFGFGPDDFVVGICAALRPEKKHEDLLEAVSRLKGSGLSVKCFIIGDGPCRVNVEARIKALGLDDDAVITGFQEDVRPFILACDCMAIVSQSETFSIAALESMSLGKPMIMSAIGGAGEQVEDGVNGFLYPAGSIDGLVNSLCKLTDSAFRASMGGKARQRVQDEFSLQSMLEKYETLFEQCVQKS